MAQHDYNEANDTFPAVRADRNNLYQAIATLNSGASAPSTTFAGMLWYDTTNNVYKQRNAADSGWVTLWAEDQGGFVPQDGSTIYAASTTGDDTYVITLDPAPTALTEGQLILFKPDTGNTGACTLNPNSIGATAIKKNVDDDLDTGDIVADQVHLVVYDGTNFQLLSRSQPSQPINAQTGTTYTIVAADRGKLITFSNASAVAVTLPQAGTAGFEAGFWCKVVNLGAGTVTITPTTSTYNGDASVAVATDEGLEFASDGSNYFGTIPASSGVFTEKFNSTAQTITSSGTLSLPHGFTGGEPEFLQCFIVCTSAEFGYAVGDKVPVRFSHSGSSGRGYVLMIDSTNVDVEFGSATEVFWLPDISGSGEANLTNASWEFYVSAWR